MGVPEPMDEFCTQSLQCLSRELLQKDPLLRPTLQCVLSRPPLNTEAEAASSRHSLAWPPLACAETGPASRSGVVQKLRGNVAVAGSEKTQETNSDVYDDYDTEAYADDFEEASGSDASYEEDFEALSDADSESGECVSPPPVLELSEAQVRQRLRDELGDEALAAAEKFGIVSFLGTVV